MAIILLHHNSVAILCMHFSTVSWTHFIVFEEHVLLSIKNMTKIDSGSSVIDCDGQCMQFVWTSLYSWCAVK